MTDKPETSEIRRLLGAAPSADFVNAGKPWSEIGQKGPSGRRALEGP